MLTNKVGSRIRHERFDGQSLKEKDKLAKKGPKDRSLKCLYELKNFEDKLGDIIAVGLIDNEYPTIVTLKACKNQSKETPSSRCYLGQLLLAVEQEGAIPKLRDIDPCSECTPLDKKENAIKYELEYDVEQIPPAEKAVPLDTLRLPYRRLKNTQVLYERKGYQGIIMNMQKEIVKRYFREFGEDRLVFDYIKVLYEFMKEMYAQQQGDSN